MDVDTAAWSGDGEFTARLLDVLKQVEAIALIRVQDAPASRAGTGYNLLANEVYVGFRLAEKPERRRWLGVISLTRHVKVPSATLADLESILAATDGVGPADYADEGMLQYLKAERIVQPYQTRGYKLVELVRVYEVHRSVP
jgi:hypothetical protein